jgi:hypothetical protein
LHPGDHRITFGAQGIVVPAVTVDDLLAGDGRPSGGAWRAPMSANADVLTSPDQQQSPSPRDGLRGAHRERDVARHRCAHLADALERARAELQRFLDAQRDWDAAHEAAMARAVAARTAALLEGESGVESVELVLPASGTDNVELSRKIATARAVEEQVVAKLNDAEVVLRRSEAAVSAVAVALLVEFGEQMAHELEITEANARARRASLRALANLWIPGAPRPRPLPVGTAAHWILGDGNANVTEAITGLRAQQAKQLGHVMPQELPPPDWQAILGRLLIDPEAELT